MRFGDLVAVDTVSLTVPPGQISVLLGENGAGKSTLMKVLYGIHRPASGEVLVNGKSLPTGNPAAARDSGLGMVFQDFRLIPALTVLENIMLVRKVGGLSNQAKEVRRNIIDLSREYGLNADPDSPIWQLDVGQQQRVEILKALATGARCIFFDEPTSVLASTEVASFIELLKRLSRSGIGVLCVTHKLDEALEMADVIHVMRGGRLIASHRVDDDEPQFTKDTLITEMVGQAAPEVARGDRRLADGENEAIAVRGLTVLDDRGRQLLDQVSFRVESGRILGVAGISGNGQKELAECIVGLRKFTDGTISAPNVTIESSNPGSALAARIADVPPNVVQDSIIPSLTVLQHISFGPIEVPRKRFQIDWRRLRRWFEGLAVRHELKVPDSRRVASSLSGGNAQRVVLARMLSGDPDWIIASYPSRGLDIATTRVIQQQLLQRRDAGAGILLFSEDLSELYALADDLIVISGGEIHGPFDPDSTTREQIGHTMVGQS